MYGLISASVVCGIQSIDNVNIDIYCAHVYIIIGFRQTVLHILRTIKHGKTIQSERPQHAKILFIY